MEWQQVSADFVPDGSLRDIYVLRATPSDWQNVVDELRSFDPPPVFLIDGEAAEMPENIEEILAARISCSPMLQIDLGKINLNCHFFGGENIEFDLDPNEVTGQREFDALLNFMRFLGSTTGKIVVLTPENFLIAPILRCSPHSDEIEWLPRA